MVKQKNRFNLRSRIVPKRLGVLLLTLTFLALPLVLYFTLYISSRTDYLTNRDFRQLASISVQVEDRIDELKGLFIRVVKKTITDKNEYKLSPQALFQQQLGNKKTLEAITAPEAKKGLNQQQAEKITEDVDSAVSMKLVTGGETSTLSFIWSGSPEFPKGAKAKTALDEVVGPFVGKRTLESRKGSEHEEGFDVILIASLKENNPKNQQQQTETSVKSKIIFQQGSSDLDVDSLDNLTNADVPDKTIDLRILGENSTSADIRLAGTTYKIYSQPIEIPIRTTGSETASDEAETHWVVCGLVQASHFRHEAWAFPYTWLIGFVFATVVIFLSWPFLKLQFIGPKDRLRLADFYWIGFSLLVGSAMLTFFLLYGVSYIRSEDLLDHQLEQTSLDINNRFQEEVALILKELSDLKSRGPDDLNLSEEGKIKFYKNNRRWAVGAAKYSDVVQTDILQGDISTIGNNAGVKLVQDDKSKVDVKSEAYPYFRRAAWIDKEGNPRLEWMTSSFQILANVKDRNYFNKILEGSSRGNKIYQPSPAPSPDNFWLEPVTSKLTTDKIVVVSSSIKDKSQNAGKVALIAFDPAMMSLMRTVVPSDFGYRVIDNSGNDLSDHSPNNPGKVLFQSSESQQLEENYFEECDNNHLLRSLIFGHARGFADVNYKGESHRIFIRPMDGFPNWSLVVFRNKQPLRTIYLQILTIAGFIFFCYAILLLVPLTIVYLFRIRKNNRTEWIWPTSKKVGVYRKTGYAYLLLCALSLAVIFGFVRFPGVEGERWTPIVVPSLIAFSGVLILALRPNLDWLLNKLYWIVNKSRLNKLLDYGNAYVCNVVILLVLLGILPAVTFYKVVYNEEMKLFTKRAQVTFARGLEERYRRVKTQYSAERADAASNPSPFGDNSKRANDFIDQRSHEWRDIYADFWTQYSTSKPGQNTKLEPALDGLMAWLIKSVPSFNETSVEMEGLTQGKAADQLWGWNLPVDENNLSGRESLPDNLIFQPHLPGLEGVQISTQLQRFGHNWQVAWLWMTVGFAIILVALFLVVRFVVRRVFHLDLTDNLYLPTRSADEISQNVFLVQTSPFANGTTNGDSNSPPQHYIDLATEASEGEWLRKLEVKATGQGAPSHIVVDHFEFRMNNRTHNDQKLRLIKSLLAAKKSVLIKSSHLPSTFSFTGAERDALKRHPSQSSDNWAEIMTHFRRSYEAKANARILRKAITTLRHALDSNTKIKQERKDQALKLAKLIKKECASSAWLANIGQELIESLEKGVVESNYIFGQLMDRAELSYRKLWNNCSNDEKLTLLHLAQDGLLSYHDPDIEPLIQSGLIVCAPDIRLMNKTFKAFVLSQCFLDTNESAKVQSAETQARKASYLESLQIPVIIGFVGMVLFLLFTQKDMFSSSLTLVTAATTSIPTVFKVLSLFKGDSTGQKIFNA